jgi:hypothetical protein
VFKRDFEEWAAQSKVIVVRDIAKLNDDDWNTLKSFFARPPDSVCINRKNMREVWIPNIMNFVVMTNNDDALPAKEESRRLLILHARKPTRDPLNPHDTMKPYNPDTFNRYIERAEVQVAWARWLLARKLDWAALRGEAPWTQAKDDTVRANETDLERRVRQLRDEREEPFTRELFTAKDVFKKCFSVGVGVTETAVTVALKKTKVAQKLTKQPRVGKVKKSPLWATAAMEVYERLTDVQLWREYQRQCEGHPPSRHLRLVPMVKPRKVRVNSDD